MSLGFDHLAFCALLFVVGLPLAAGWVPPNPLYGFRTPATQTHPRLWYAVNARTGRDLMGVALTLGVFTWVFPRLFPALGRDVHVGFWATTLVVGLLGVLARGGVLLRALQAESDPEEPPGDGA